jgi:hypothetical protein
MFFFEKKNQKTFAGAVAVLSCQCWDGMDKVFAAFF